MLVVFFGGFLARRKALWNAITPNPFLGELLAQAIRVAVVLLGLILVLNLLGASSVIATILGGAGVVGLAIGFAVRDSMENYISSIMLSLRQPFRAKDHVVINDFEGVVVRLTSRATILMTLEGNHLRIPNATVFKGIILNYTTNPERRLEFELGVDAADDPIAGMKVGLDAIRGLDFLLKKPTPDARIQTVGDSNIVLRFNGWVDQRDTNFSKARSLAIRTAMRALEDNGFSLPEPIYRLRSDPQLNSALESRLGISPQGPAGNLPSSVSNSPRTPAALTQDEFHDVAVDSHLEQIIEQEIQQDSDSDLLDEDRPHE